MMFTGAAGRKKFVRAKAQRRGGVVAKTALPPITIDREINALTGGSAPLLCASAPLREPLFFFSSEHVR